MNIYRIYVLNAQDRVADIVQNQFADDRQALEAAEDLGAGEYAAEVWAGERLVGRLGGELRLAAG